MKNFTLRWAIALLIMIPFAAFAQVPQAPCNDITEPNDLIGQAFDLGTISNGYTNDSLCLTAGDNDYFRFTLNNAVYYLRVRGFSNYTQGGYGIVITVDSSFLSVSTRSVAGSRTDTYLYLMDANGATLEQNDDYNRTLFSQVTYNYQNPVRLSVNPSQLTVATAGDSTSFTITAENTNWTIQAPTWLTLSTLNGTTGSTTVRVFAAANTTRYSRVGYISIVGANNRRLGIWVNQAGTPFTCADNNEPNNSRTQVTNLGNIATTWQDSSLCLSPTGDEDWFSFVADSTSYLLRVKGFSMNTQGRYGLRIGRSQGFINIATFLSPGSTTTDTYIYLMNANGDVLAQNDDFGGSLFSQLSYGTSTTPSITVTPFNLTLAATSGRSVVSVQSNVAWTVQNLPSWITVSPSSGGNGITNVWVTAQNNLDSNSRMAMLGFTGVGAGQMVMVTQQGGTPVVINCSDPYEPNNSVAAAYNLGNLSSTSFRDTSLCLTVADADYFKFTIDSVLYYAHIRPFTQTSTTNLGRYGLNIARNNTSFTVNTFAVSGSTTTDTYLYVYGASGVNVLGQNDDFGGTRYSSVTISTVPGVRPANDEPCGAVALLDTMPVISTIENATLTNFPLPATNCGSNQRDVWFTAIMPSSGVMTIRTTAGTLRDAVMGIYLAQSCDSIFAPPVACEDDNRNGNGSFMPVLTVRHTPGMRIYVRVWGFSNIVGTFNVQALPYETVNFGGSTTQNAAAKEVKDVLSAFPNPVSSNLTFTYKAIEADKTMSVNLIDALGRVVKTEQFPVYQGANTLEMSVSDVPNGMYFLKMGRESVRIIVAH